MTQNKMVLSGYWNTTTEKGWQEIEKVGPWKKEENEDFLFTGLYMM
jgi:hypothetical protein